MHKIMIQLQAVFFFFLMFFSMADPLFAKGSSDVAIIWDKSGSMFRVQKKERMKPKDLERLNRYVVSALMRGTVEVDPEARSVDSIEQNNLNGPIVDRNSRVTVIDFGLTTHVRFMQVPIRDGAHLMSLLPPTDKRKETYTEQNTYYRKAFVYAHDLISGGSKPHKFLVTISDETESYPDKDPEIEDRFSRMERETKLVFFMVVNRMVNFKIYDLSPPATRIPTPTPSHVPSPTCTSTPTKIPPPTQTPKPTCTARPTRMPTPTRTPPSTCTATPTKMPTPTPTITPLPITAIRLVDEKGRDVTRITLYNKGKGRNAVVTNKRKFRWEVPDGIVAYPGETICTFANQDPVDVVFEKEGFFRIRAYRNFYKNHKGQQLHLKLPFETQSGKRDFYDKALANSIETDVTSVLVGLIVICVLIGGAFSFVMYILAPKEAIINVQQSLDSNGSSKVVLNSETPEAPLPVQNADGSSHKNPYKLSFDGEVVRLIDIQKGETRDLPTNEKYTLSFNDQTQKTFMVQIRKKWPWSSNG